MTKDAGKNITAFSMLCVLVGIIINVVYLINVYPESPLTKLSFGSDTLIGKYPGCDFNALYFPAANIIKGRPLYDPPLKSEFKTYSEYRYAPVGILMGLPFAFFNQDQAFRLWITLIQMLLVINVYLLYRISENPKIFGLGSLLVLAPYPVFLELFTGQFSVLQATFIFLALAALHVENEKRFTAPWIFTLCWKLNTWIAAPALVAKRKFKEMAVAMGVLVATSIPVFILYPGAWDSFFRNNVAGGDPSITPSNLSMAAFLAAFFPKGTEPEIIVFVTAVIIGAATLIITYAGRKAHLVELICLWLSAYFIVYRHIWENHYLMLVPVILIFAVRHRLWVLLIPGILVCLPTFYFMIERWTFWPRILYHGTGVLPGLMMFGISAWLVLKKADKIAAPTPASQ